MSKNTPAPPDYAGAANAQAQSSREVTEQQTWANRPTVNTPFGQQTWEVTPTWDPSTGQYINQWTQNTNLTPESQAALSSQQRLTQGRSDMAEGLLDRSRQEFGTPMDWSQFVDMSGTVNPENIQKGVGNTPDYIKSAEDAIYNQWSNRMDPRMKQDTADMRTQLYNQGLKEGDAAFDREMQRMTQDQADARQQAQYQATIGAGQEAQRQQGMDVQSGNFANTAAEQAFQQRMQSSGFQNTLRQQQIAEQMQQRGFSLNEINAILSGQQVGMPSMPSFNAANRSEGVQALQAAQMQGQYGLDAYNAQQQGTQGTLSGMAGMAMMFSDRRLKKNVKFLEERAGLKWYEYEYLWEDGKKSVGVMADEVSHIPDAVWQHPTGYLMVDYGVIHGQ